MTRRAIRPGRVYGDKECLTQPGFNTSKNLTNFSVINKCLNFKSEILNSKQIQNHNFSKSNIINTILPVTKKKKMGRITQYAFFHFLSHFEPFYHFCLIRRYYAQSLG